ncbi:uncharacterized protein LOC109196228 isoform X1 [Oreochromis niloticus]|uniref:Uncharacterized LOC109196228 n=1 Tax=Oreochromis niloticus TaxID=8128 RepID=I3KPV8_ORENI|nr:uncharacterized protein LOC109196228 isoform X1 [Oreochromis niloticus]
MGSFAVITALFFCIHCWISVSGSGFQTVEVQPREEVTLQCTNTSNHQTQADWFKVVNQTKPTCVSSMFGSHGSASFCDGFQNGQFIMSSNITFVFLQIKQVNLSDVGLYFCGFYTNKHTVISDAVELRIQGNGEPNDEVKLSSQEECNGNTKAVTVMFISMALFFMMTSAALAIKVRQLHAASKKELHLERNKMEHIFCYSKAVLQDEGSLHLNSAALWFLAKTRSRRPAIERKVETHVVYYVGR